MHSSDSNRCVYFILETSKQLVLSYILISVLCFTIINRSSHAAEHTEKFSLFINQNVQGISKKYCHDSLLKSVDGIEGKLPSEDNKTKSRFNLIQVHALLRHGDRSPSIKIPTTQYECGMIDGDERWLGLSDFRIIPNPTSANLLYLDTELFRGFQSQMCAEFQLTLKGFRQLYATGIFMRERYSNHFTAEPLKPTDILIQCTNYRRTIHSSASFALGFIPSDSLKRSDISIYTSPGSKLRTPPPGRPTVYQPCRNFVALKKQDLLKSGYLNEVSKLKPLFNDMAYLMDIKRADLSIEDVFDNVWGMVCHDLPLSCKEDKCITESMIAAGMDSVDWSFPHKYPKASSILAMQPFLFHSIINEIDIAINSGTGHNDQQQPYKFLFNFAHDSTLTSLLVLLGIQLDVWLPYASRIVLEVWQDSLISDHYYIRLLFNGQSLMKQLVTSYPKDAFELDGELLSYESWRESMMTGTYRDKNDYHDKCNQNSL